VHDAFGWANAPGIKTAEGIAKVPRLSAVLERAAEVERALSDKFKDAGASWYDGGEEVVEKPPPPPAAMKPPSGDALFAATSGGGGGGGDVPTRTAQLDEPLAPTPRRGRGAGARSMDEAPSRTWVDRDEAGTPKKGYGAAAPGKPLRLFIVCFHLPVRVRRDPASHHGWHVEWAESLIAKTEGSIANDQGMKATWVGTPFDDRARLAALTEAYTYTYTYT